MKNSHLTKLVIVLLVLTVAMLSAGMLLDNHTLLLGAVTTSTITTFLLGMKWFNR